MTISKPTNQSAAELELKRRGRRRLVGAVTLGIVAILVLPMVFDSEPNRKETARQEIEVKVPSQEGLPALVPPMTRPAAATTASAVPVPAVSPPSALAVPGPADSSAKSAAQVAPDPSAATKRAPEVESKAVATKEVVAVPKSPIALKVGFVIQLGAFKDAENAKSVVARMKEAQLPVFTDTVPVKTGNVTRVRVGPFATRDGAESALAQVKLAGVDGKVVAFP